jgi:SAM-dependent methyltransferase
MDNWITSALAPALRRAAEPLAVDLGFGATAVTTVELAGRLRRVRPDVRVVGVEIDAERVAAADSSTDVPGVGFVHGGFELAGLRPALVRAANVLRQYPEDAVLDAWNTMGRQLAPGGYLVEGTSDELGRRAWWVLIDGTGPVSLTVACRPEDVVAPARLADRLPKALIHRNVPGEAIHAFLGDLDSAWRAAAPLAAFGARQRWVAMCRAVSADWPVRTERSRYGELTVAWSAVAPG